MIACRSLFSALKVTNNFVTSSSVRRFQFQRRYFYRAANCYLKIDIRDSVFDRMDRKISTQSTSPTEYEVDDETHVTHGSQQYSVEVGELKEESTISANKESLAVESSPSTERHAQKLEVGASLMRFIKGKGGATQKMIEDETGVKVIFPSSKKEDAITIVGNSAESLNIASRKIEAIVHEVVNSTRLDYSHFVSLPLAVHPELVDKLLRFQNSILGTSEADGTFLDSSSVADASDEGNVVHDSDKDTEVAVKSEAATSDMGIDRSIFIKPTTIHLTLLMLKLWNKEKLEAAAEVLQSVSTKVVDALDSRPISIRLKGLQCMKGSYAKARVLHIPVEEVGGEGRLLRACQVIIDAFIEAGLVLERDAQHNLKLHATVMNVRHRRRKGQPKKWNNDFFDARMIVNRYGTMEWGDFVIPQAHLSERFAFDDNGYYHCCTSIPFPENVPQD